VYNIGVSRRLSPKTPVLLLVGVAECANRQGRVRDQVRQIASCSPLFAPDMLRARIYIR
jgi:hypothetical protein